MNVLLVESDKLLADNVSAALQMAGHGTYWHVNLQSAIEALDNTKPDIIVLDLALTNRSGAELLYEIQSYPEWHGLPVIIWTDLARSEIDWLIEDIGYIGAAQYHHKSTTSLKSLIQAISAQPAAA